MLWTVFYFMLALFLLVTIHEAGHFLVARRCGVKVLRFSFGFGPVLFSWRDKHGTAFTWSLIPLGGYVKFLDDVLDDVPEHEKHLMFRAKSLQARVAIILAGPLFNFLLAWVAFWCVAVIGMTTLAPIVGQVKSGSLAEASGFEADQEWTSVNGTSVQSWRDVRYTLMPYMGSEGLLDVTVRSRTKGGLQHVQVPLGVWSVPLPERDPLEHLGIEPRLPRITPKVAEVFPGSPAEKAGLREGDEVLAVDDRVIHDWRTFVFYVKNHPDQSITLKLKRAGLEENKVIPLGHHMQDGRLEGLLGVRSARGDWPQDMIRMQRDNPLRAVLTASKQTWLFTEATLAWMSRMIQGHVAIKNLSGPVGMAEGAGDSARGGLVYYLSFLGLVSIGLGVLNLLPIPMLDGGHLMYALIEGLTGRPLSERFKMVSVSLGLILLMALTAVALKNDLVRLTGS